MTIFYRGPGVRVTHEVLEVWRPTHRRYALRELRQVCVLERPAPPPVPVVAARNGSSGVAGATALVAALAWAEGWQALSAPVPGIAIIALLAGSMAVSGACWLVRPMQWELAATYRGHPATLYRSRDARTFGQVRRAVTRALEHAGDTQ